MTTLDRVSKLTIGQFLTETAGEDESVKYSQLLELSGLSSEQTAEFEAAWSSVPVDRRRELVGKLTELSEDNLQLDFISIYIVCLDDADSDIRESAIRGLWECEDRVLIRPLVRIVGSDPSKKVRAAAAISLGKFAAMARDAKLVTRDESRIRTALMAVIEREGEETEVRRRAIESAAALGGPEIEDLINDSYQSTEPELKQSALYAMGRTSSPRWLSTVLAETAHKDAAIRYEAASAAGLLGDESTVPHLVQMIDDEDPEVQIAAIRALGAIGGALAKTALRRYLDIDNEALESAAQEAMDELALDDDPLGLQIQP